MAHAWQLLREHEARVAKFGWCGKPVTIADCITRAWRLARQEMHFAKDGGTVISNLLIEISADAAPEFKQAA